MGTKTISIFITQQDGNDDGWYLNYITRTAIKAEREAKFDQIISGRIWPNYLLDYQFQNWKTDLDLNGEMSNLTHCGHE